MNIDLALEEEYLQSYYTHIPDYSYDDLYGDRILKPAESWEITYLKVQEQSRFKEILILSRDIPNFWTDWGCKKS